MIVYKDIEQGTEEWAKLRRGRLGASEYKHVITATGKLSKSKAAIKFMHKLALQLIAADPAEADKQRKMEYRWDIKWGNDHEPVAREWFRTNILPVECVGYIVRDDREPIGCSPDGLIPAKGNKSWESGLEIKCPALSTHLEWKLEEVLPEEHAFQVHGSMALTGLNSWYFLSYFPGVEPFWLKVEREDITDKIESALNEFIVVYGIERKRVFEAMLPGKCIESEVAA